MSKDYHDEVHDDDYDPFEAFDATLGVGQVRDPYPVFREMLAECPVHAGTDAHRFGIQSTGASVLFGDATPYSVLPFDASQQALRNAEALSSSIMAKFNGVIMGHTIIEMDGAEHRKYRGLIQQAFTPNALERWEHGIVQSVVDRFIDAFADQGRADLVRDLFFASPIHIIAAMLGLPEEDMARFHRKALELVGMAADIERSLAASQWLHDYFSEIIADRRTNPRDDIITILVQAELDDQQLTDEEIIAFLRLLLPAGAETTYRSSANLMFGLLTHPDQLDALRADRSLLSPAIEEGLRWETPVTGVTRITTGDTEIAGTVIPEGSPVQIRTGCANHDPARWEDPERFDIFRDPQHSLAFGFGPHICLGMHLARMEMKVMVNTLLDRLPNLHLDPEAEDVHISGLSFRSPAHLPVLFDPVET